MTSNRFPATHLHGPGGILELVKIALPLVISYACDTVMMFTDRLFLSRIGGEAMAGTMAGGLGAFTFTTFLVGIIGYANAMVAQRYGAGEKARCPAVTFQALILTVAAYPLILACIPLGLHLFSLSGISPKQQSYQNTYFTILMFGTIISLLRGSIGSFFSGIGRTRIIMIASGISMLCNIGLNYLLIFGKCGFPALGIAGAAYGTIIAGAIGLAVMIFAYFKPRYTREYSIYKSFRFDKKLMGELLRFGYPAGAEMLLNIIAFSTLVAAFQSCGPVVATAITITFNWDMVSFVPMLGLNIAVTSLAGRYYGARNFPLVHRSAWSGMKLSALYSALLVIPYFFFTDALVGIFLSPGGEHLPEIRSNAHYMVKMICLYLFCDGILQVFGGALRGVGDTFWTMCASISMHWTFALVSLVMLKVLHADAKTTWTAIIVIFFCFGPILLVRFRSGIWEKRNCQVC